MAASSVLLSPPLSCGKVCDSICSKAPAKYESAVKPVGIFDIFKIGVGPSSSHTVGAMVAGNRFVKDLGEGRLRRTAQVKVDLFGSFALTGVGHGTDKAILVGLTGAQAAVVEPDECVMIFERVMNENRVFLGGLKDIIFVPSTHMIFHFKEELPQHPNGLRLSALDDEGVEIFTRDYLSIGGGFVKTAEEMDGSDETGRSSRSTLASSESFESADEEQSPPQVPFLFRTAAELLRVCRTHQKDIFEVMIENEMIISNCSRDAVYEKLDDIWMVMTACIERGLMNEGPMPVSGILRQAKKIHKRLIADGHKSLVDHFAIMDWVTLYARSVNEENACGGRVVTSPTNGAAGTLPAVLKYYREFVPTASKEGVRRFLATAAAFGILLKTNASISGAEAGCQAEVGSACAMAAAGLTAVMGGTSPQIENAAEIGLEHNLGLTCDPLLGLVQVPCIERNCVAAIHAITASRLSMKGDGSHEVSFDSCVETMYRTGIDLQAKYRETSEGGLAIYARRGSHRPRRGSYC